MKIRNGKKHVLPSEILETETSKNGNFLREKNSHSTVHIYTYSML